MLDVSKDIHPLSEFQRNAKAFLARLKKTGRPAVLTVNGRSAMVVQDVKSYKKLLDAIDRAEAIEGIRRGLEDVKAGRTRPAKEVHNELLKKYGISR